MKCEIILFAEYRDTLIVSQFVSFPNNKSKHSLKDETLSSGTTFE